MNVKELKIIEKIINDRLMDSAKRLYPIPNTYTVTVEDSLLNKPRTYLIAKYRPFYHDYSGMSDEMVIEFLIAAIQGSCNVIALADIHDKEHGKTLILTSNNSISKFILMQ